MHIFHLVPAERWRSWPADSPYLPAEYEHDGFIHCTAGEELMLRVANSYYRQVQGNFVLLVLDVERLRAPLRWEPPAHPATDAPSSGQAGLGSAEEADAAAALLFPHLYGPINPEAIVQVRQAQRAPDGSFISWGAH